MNLDPILDRLERVKRVKPGVYKACCPAHEDKTPSLEIKDAGDRALLICRAGCSFDEIREAIEMPAHAFFDGGRPSLSPVRGVSRRELDAALAFELLTAYVIVRDRAEGETVPEVDRARYKLARARILHAMGGEQ